LLSAPAGGRYLEAGVREQSNSRESDAAAATGDKRYATAQLPHGSAARVSGRRPDRGIVIHLVSGEMRDDFTAAVASAGVGYESPYQFSREFRRFFGRSPGEEKRNMKSAFTLRPANQMVDPSSRIEWLC
jgi:AraC-like DNA-binding protein